MCLRTINKGLCVCERDRQKQIRRLKRYKHMTEERKQIKGTKYTEEGWNITFVSSSEELNSASLVSQPPKSLEAPMSDMLFTVQVSVVSFLRRMDYAERFKKKKKMTRERTRTTGTTLFSNGAVRGNSTRSFLHPQKFPKIVRQPVDAGSIPGLGPNFFMQNYRK